MLTTLRHRRDQGARRAAGRQQWPGPHGPGDRGGRRATSRTVRAAQALRCPRRVHHRSRAHQERLFLRPRRQSPGDLLPGIIKRQRQTVPTRGAGRRRRHAARWISRRRLPPAGFRAEGWFASWGVMPRGMHRPPPFPEFVWSSISNGERPLTGRPTRCRRLWRPSQRLGGTGL
jgi:hypothetical protein